MTSPTRPCGPRARPGDRHGIAALLRGELSSARGPGGALTRQHTTYHAAASIPRGRRAMMPLTKRMQHESLGRFRSRSSPEAGGRRTVRVRSGSIRAEAASGVTQFDRPVRDGNQPPSRSRDAFHESYSRAACSNPTEARPIHPGLARASTDIREAHPDELLHERLRKRTIDREVQRALGHLVALELIAELPKDRAAERQVA